MKKQRNFRTLFLGASTVLLGIWVSNPVIAAVQQTISVIAGINISIDNVEQPSIDANGNSIEALVYNNVVYVPAQIVTTVSGKQVQWDQESQRVYIGSYPGGSTAAYLCQMNTFTEKGRWRFNKVTKDNLGNEHTHSITPFYQNTEGNLVYKLNKQYNRLTALYYQLYDKRSSAGTTVLTISGDGQQLWEGTMSSGIEPLNIDIDVTNVSELKIEYQATCSGNTSLGDVALWQ